MSYRHVLTIIAKQTFRTHVIFSRMVETAQGDPLIGSMLGKNYRVLELIGVGGMAVVYLVEHQTLLKRFAAKVLRAEHATSAEARARFTQEAHAASQLDHENIVGISDFGVTPDQRPFFVMELLRGQTLADRLEEGPMTLEEVVAVCVPAARALAHAHAEGIVHRDVKPENIMLVQRSHGRWTVKVLDFGIAKVEENDSMTKTGQAIGSPMYMSPEACRGEDVDMRADVYSFGVVLYLMFAGRVPFMDENILKILQMQVSSPVPPPTTFAPNLPYEIEAVIMKALAKNVDDRYANMEELLVALEDALPDGADVVLLQAQFGAAATPFPGSIERVRAAGMSGNFQRVNTTGRHNIQSTGQHTVNATGQQTPLPTHPPAPERKRGWIFAVGAVVLLGGGGAGAYVYLQGRDDAKHVTASPSTAPEAIATAPAAALEPAEVASAEAASAVPVAEPTADITPDTADAADTDDTTPTDAAPKNTTVDRKRQPPAKTTRVVATAAKVVLKETKAPTTIAAGSAATGSAGSASISATGSGSAGSGSATASAAGSGSSAPSTTAMTTTPTTTLKPPTGDVAAQPKETVTTTPPTPTVTPKVNVGSLDATPAIASLGVEGSLPSSVVRRSVERVLPSLQACYRTAAKAKNSTPAVSVKVRFVIDENGAATRVGATGNFGSLAECVRGSMTRVQSPHAPDVGTVSVTVGINFTPT